MHLLEVLGFDFMSFFFLYFPKDVAPSACDCFGAGLVPILAYGSLEAALNEAGGRSLRCTAVEGDEE